MGCICVWVCLCDRALIHVLMYSCLDRFPNVWNRNKLREGRKQCNRHQANSSTSGVSCRFFYGIQMSRNTRWVGLMAQSVQVNYSLSWEEVQTEKITSVQIVERSFRVSWRAHYVSWEEERGMGLWGSDRVLGGGEKSSSHKHSSSLAICNCGA